MDNQTPSVTPNFGDPLLQVSFSSPQQKNDKEFGRKLLSRIYKEQSNSSSVYFFSGRAARLKELVKWAMGRQTIQEFLDLLKIDGNNAYTGIDPTPNRTGPQFVEVLVNSMSQNDEYPCVTAVDDGSMTAREERQMDALLRMRSQKEIAAMEDAGGMMLEPPDAYVPENELAAEVYFKLEDRLPIEIKLEQKLDKVMSDNEYPLLKRRLYRDGIVGNIMCTKIEKHDNGYIGIRKCSIPNLIYNFFVDDSGKMDITYIGEVYSLKVRDFRKRYAGTMTEKEIFDFCKTATVINVANRFNYFWNDSFLYATDRPYDDYNIQVFDCEIKVYDTDYYVSKPDSYGKEIVDRKNGIPQPTSADAKIIKKNKFTVYRGVYAIASDKMIYWGLPDVVIKPYMDISESLFSYTINIPNNDGEYVPSLFERALEPLKQYMLCKFRIKQLIAAMAPAGVTIDVETIRDIEFNGQILKWEQIVSMRQQSGVVLWSSRGLNPLEKNNRPPIEGIANAESIAQLNELANMMDRSMQEIRSVLGVPLYRDGSDLPPRMGQAVVENQASSSNNVTDYIKHGFHALIQETLHKICILKWDEIVVAGQDVEHLNTVLRVDVEMKATAYENKLIEDNIATWSRTPDGNGNFLLTPKDVFYIRNIKNYKLQDLYLTYVIESNQKRAAEKSSQQQQQNGQIQQQSLMAQMEGKMKIVELQKSMEAQVKAADSQGKKQEILLAGFLDMLKTTGNVPAILEPVAQQILQSIIMPLVQENKENVEQAQAQAQQEQQMQQIQQIAQESGMPPEQVMQLMQQGQQGEQPQQQAQA